MIDEKTAKYRTINQKERQDGTLIYKDLIDAYDFFYGKCPYSDTQIDEKNWHLEHIIPVKMGGTTDPWNCIPVCGPCNLSKGSDHLLDWWDETHKSEEEYKLEKIFLYLLKVLSKDRDIRITTSEEKEKLKKLEEKESLSLSDDSIDTTKKLDTFTFMYQLLNHLSDSKQIPPERLIQYSVLLQTAQDKNKQLKKLDIEVYERQREFIQFLKQIGVQKHYTIAFEHSDKVTSIDTIKENINNISQYLKDVKISNLIDKNPEILFMDINTFKYNFEYLTKNVKIPRNIIIQKPTLLNEIELAKEFYETCLNVNFDINNITNASFSRGNLKQFITILKSKEFQEHPKLFTSQVLAKSTPERIAAIIASKEFQEHPELFTSKVLAQSTPERIAAIIASKEFQEHPELFTSTTLAQSTPERIAAIIASKEFQEHPELFTSKVLAQSTPERIAAIIASKEFQEHPELFTSTTLAQSTPERIAAIIASKEFQEHPELFTSTTLAQSTPERIAAIIASKEFQEHPELFTSTTLAQSTPERIAAIIASKEFQEHPELFTSQVLAKSTPERIAAIIASKEFQEHPELFTSKVLAQSTPEKIAAIIASKEFQEHPELFTSTTLAQSTPERIAAIIASKEFQEHPELFTSTTLAQSTPERIAAIIASKEFQEHPELFTSTTLAQSTPERIAAIIASKEFQEHPELFTSTTLAQSTPERIAAIIASKEFQEHPELFTSEVLARSTPEKISDILLMPEWKEEKYKHLLQPSILTKSKEKISLNIKLAEEYGIEECISIKYLIKSPSQNYALINYILDNNIQLKENGKLNSIFSYQPGVLLKKYGIDLKQLMEIYPYEERKNKNAVR